MGLHSVLDELGNFGKELGVLSFRKVSDSREVECDILEGTVSHFPGLFGILQVGVVQFETEATAFRDFGCLPTVEDKIGVALFRSHVTDMVEKIHMPGSFKKFLSNMDQGFWEEEGPSGSIPLLINVEESPGKALRLLDIVTVSLSCQFAARSDRRNILKVFRNFPIEIKIGEDRLTPSGDSLLGKFKDHHLSQLL
jgi:hypothetical protein